MERKDALAWAVAALDVLADEAEVDAKDIDVLCVRNGYKPEDVEAHNIKWTRYNQIRDAQETLAEEYRAMQAHDDAMRRERWPEPDED